MKNPFLFALLGAAACSSPKYKNAVIVKDDNVEVRQAPDKDAGVVALADKGDTLELRGRGDGKMYEVSLDARQTRFKGSVKRGYVAARHLQIPDSTLSKMQLGTLTNLPSVTPSKPEHIKAR